MEDVLVNGVPVIADGKMTGALPGKVLRGEGMMRMRCSRGPDRARESGLRRRMPARTRPLTCCHSTLDDDRELVARIARSAGRKAGYKQLVRELGLGGGRERRLLLEQLARLTVRGELTKMDREHWSIPAAGRAARATTWSRAASTCIATATALCGPTRGRLRDIDEDIFIPPN